MAEQNAKITLENSYQEKYNIVKELKEVLQMDKLPRKIETYDISNIAGSHIVAGMCVMQDGVIKKNLSRRFRIKTVEGQDDPKCMAEVVRRRLKHSIENPKGAFGELPDTIFVDGGITELRAVKGVIEEYQLSIPVFGMVKNEKHTTRALIDENRVELPLSEELKKQITLFQDTVHHTAIEYHKKLRDKEITKSSLDAILGIGEVKKQALLKKFGSITKIKEASIEEISSIQGINEKMARTIKEELEKE